MPYAPGQTTGFTSVPDYLSANQGTLDREAGDVNSLVGSELDSAKTAADQFANTVTGPDFSKDAGYAGADQKQLSAQQDAQSTRNQGGLQDLLGRTPSGRGATAFDGLLLGAHGGFQGTQSKAETLHDYLNSASASHNYSGAIDPARTQGGGIGGYGATTASQPQSPATPGQAAGISDGDAGAPFTPAPSTDQPAGASQVRRTRSPFTMGGF